MKEKKLQACKPDSVSFDNRRMAIIYLFRQLPGGINLPTLYRNSLTTISGEQPSPIVYVAFQHARFTRE